MAEFIDEAGAIESTTVGVFRTAATVKGGRRFSFSALVVVGDRNGRVGVGYGKANQVPPAIEKAQKEAKRKMRLFPLTGRTIPHAVTGSFGACRVRLIPASPGTGVIAGAGVRAPLELVGIQDCLTKSYGSSNSKNLVKAVLDGLGKLRSRETIESLRGFELERTEVEDAIDRGLAYLAKAQSGGSTTPETSESAAETGGETGGEAAAQETTAVATAEPGDETKTT
ncbi:MAG: 30S ribosomal protein S5 [Phycisphaerales bacterium]|nr:30S ribosomal protein S5 [Phycisphaerae bacterium]NNF44709.1 30S ribosomal protein S5 [Phycisphaerales bacterium]NNM25244.1 30S ribosomal protein S5 [Phycisphaerales bacterium]